MPHYTAYEWLLSTALPMADFWTAHGNNSNRQQLQKWLQLPTKKQLFFIVIKNKKKVFSCDFFIFALQLRLFYAPVSITMLPQEWNFLQASVSADWIFSYCKGWVHCLMNACDLIFEQHVRGSYSLCMQILYIYERAIIFASWWITFKR